MGIRVAHRLVTPNLLDYIELSNDYSIVEMKVPACLHNKTLSTLNARVRFGCSIVALQKEAGVIIAPTALDSLQMGDIMVIIGNNADIDRFEEEVISQESLIIIMS